MSVSQTVITVGVHVLDVHVLPVEAIPEGQGAALVEQIRFSPAGTAAGTSVTLAKLGATVRTAGAVGADPIGDLLLGMLAGHGVDTSLVVRRDEVQTSASVLPIRPDGSRPAFHVPGANLAYGADDAPYAELAQATHVHLGGPELMGGENAAKILAAARSAGAVTSADLLAPGDPGILEWIAPALPYLDFLLPNDDQVRALTETDSLEDGARALIARGVGSVVVTREARGALIVTADEAIAVPAFAVAVVDTTGCGDAFSAGFLRGIALGRTLPAAAVLGCAAAALVAQGLGTDHGQFDLAAADAFAAATPTLATA
ncbi:carbohydrate kinase family protein [Actinoplanes sp. ATCC 53533]|uniref:carbohydrate kinase family protein n=1 Tax=Actinoplanes sp. ATCC 53533 TaxID=1288362 RepID=UPI000F77440F|nr:PfkB family carbohydrate kinase [Actinoplanes sp. ATCC 53533]RSM53673.1 carbohydrate kinase family protein [Actinoplanes sp. ATCC 53533]